jgi:ribulose-5-phosphate 4-epimerase/fuculose-1-phosphate aldolase
MDHAQARTDLAAAFRLTARENMHEGVANHFSLAVNEDGTEFLINPKKHFSRIRASDLWVIDANDPDGTGADAPDPTAWGLHASLHRHVPHARCAMHVHSTYATVLAALADSRLPRSTSPRPCSTTARSSTRIMAASRWRRKAPAAPACFRIPRSAP